MDLCQSSNSLADAWHPGCRVACSPIQLAVAKSKQYTHLHSRHSGHAPWTNVDSDMSAVKGNQRMASQSMSLWDSQILLLCGLVATGLWLTMPPFSLLLLFLPHLVLMLFLLFFSWWQRLLWKFSLLLWFPLHAWFLLAEGRLLASWLGTIWHINTHPAYPDRCCLAKYFSNSTTGKILHPTARKRL